MLCKDILLLAIGGLISLVTSISLLWVQRKLDRSGDLLIFYKIIIHPSGHRPGFFRQSNGMSFIIPIAFDLQNTSNSSKVMRDINVLLYKDDKYVVKTMQTYSIAHKKGNEVIREDYFGNEQHSYSIVIPPRSVQTLMFEFFYVIKHEEIQKYDFNNIRLEYHDDKNKRHVLKMREIDNCWVLKEFSYDKDWILVE